MCDLKAVYSAVDKQAALAALEVLQRSGTENIHRLPNPSNLSVKLE